MHESLNLCSHPGMAKQDDYTRYTIRIPTPLYERVKAAAGDASVNSVIITALEEKYPAPDIYTEIVAAAIEALKEMPDDDEAVSRLRKSLETLPVEHGWPYAMHLVRTLTGKVPPSSDREATAAELERLRKEYGPASLYPRSDDT